MRVRMGRRAISYDEKFERERERGTGEKVLGRS